MSRCRRPSHRAGPAPRSRRGWPRPSPPAVARSATSTTADGVIWGDPRNPAALAATLDAAPHGRWVQLPFAGIENFVHLVDDERVWTCGKGVYAEPVAEMALTLGLAGLRSARPLRPRRMRGRAPAGREPARRPGDASSAAAASPSRWCACCGRSTVTSPSCAAASTTWTASTRCSSPTATPTPSPAPTSSCSPSP